MKPLKSEKPTRGASYWKRDSVGTFERYLKSRYDTLKDCGFVIYEWSPSRNNRLKPCYTTKRGAIVSPKPPLFTKQESKDLKDIIARLNERLDEPFVTAGTVTGDKGIKLVQAECKRARSIC